MISLRCILLKYNYSVLQTVKLCYVGEWQKAELLYLFVGLERILEGRFNKNREAPHIEARNVGLVFIKWK